MLAYACVGTNDLKRSIEYYNELFSVWDGIKILINPPNECLYGTSFDEPMFCTIEPFNKQPATVAFKLPSKDMVDKMYGKAIELGSQCEGKPGTRIEGTYHAYWRDPDGNKLCGYATL